MQMPIDSQQELMNEFLTNISVNHGCLRVHKNNPKKDIDPNAVKEKIYQGTSPDEITLVNFAKDCGYEFKWSSDHNAKVKIASKSNGATFNDRASGLFDASDLHHN